MAKRLRNYRLDDEVHNMIVEMSDYTDRSMRNVVELAVRNLHAYFDRTRRYSEEKATRGMELFKRLQEVLGEDFHKGHGGVGSR